MASKEIGGKEYEINGNPLMGTVKDAQKMQMAILMEHLDEEDMREMETFDESEFVMRVIDKEGMDAVNEMVWGRSMLTAAQTITLATDEVFDIEDVESMRAGEFRELLNECEDALGGDANDFFEELGVGTSLTRSQVQNLQNQPTS